MHRSWKRMGVASALAVAGVLAAERAVAVDCTAHVARRVAQFERRAHAEVTRCLRRGAGPCPDARTAARLDGLAARVAKTVVRRCADVDAAGALAAARARVLCRALALCESGRITVRVAAGGTVPEARAAAVTGAPVARRLTADVGWSGLAHDLQILEGATYTAELRDCDGTTDTLCDFHGATAGTPFGAPSPVSAGGVAVCVAVGFASDLVGTYDLATGDLSEQAQVLVRVFNGLAVDQPCPVCMPVDGAPAVGAAGTCIGGPNAGTACRVDGLGDPSFGAYRATSHDCGPGSPGAQIAEFSSLGVATTGAFTFAPLADGPACTSSSFLGEQCLCATCNDPGGTACHSHADCPAVGGLPGTCGGRRCLGGSNVGATCSLASECPGAVCGRTGEPIAKNACFDAVCTATGEGGGECLAGPVDSRCAVARHRGCISDAECPPGDACVSENRRCSLDTIGLVGSPDAPVAGQAAPTLVGAFCMAPAGVASVNHVVGLPGPVSYVWPTEVTIGQ